MKDKLKYYMDNCGYSENIAKLALSALVETYGVNVTSKPVEYKDGVEVYEFWCPGHHEPDYNPEV